MRRGRSGSTTEPQERSPRRNPGVSSRIGLTNRGGPRIVAYMNTDYYQPTRRAAAATCGGIDHGRAAAVELAKRNFAATGKPQAVRGHDDGRHTVADFTEGVVVGPDWSTLTVVESA